MADEQPLITSPPSGPIATMGPADTSPAALLAAAVQQGMTPEALSMLVDLQIKMRAEDARASFAAAYADAQAELEPIRTDSFGYQERYRYASLPQVERAVRPALAAHGISYSWDTLIEGGRVTGVVCRLEHRDGHHRDTAYPVIVDNRPNQMMTDTQRMDSATSKSRRYALLFAVGLSTGDDDDGHAAEMVPITEQQAAELEALCDEVGADRARFLKWLQVDSFETLSADLHEKAVKGLEAKKAKA